MRWDKIFKVLIVIMMPIAAFMPFFPETIQNIILLIAFFVYFALIFNLPYKIYTFIQKISNKH